MKPRHLKSNEKAKQKEKSNNSSQKSTLNENFRTSDLYSNLIPFHKTKESIEFLDWVRNWSQSNPACIFFGPTSCGKTRTIQYTATELKCHIIEIDCSSITSIKDLVSTFHESTKSRSVGIFLNHDNSNYDNAISMVVLEHVDSILTNRNPPLASFIKMISTSLVPLVMTSQTLCLPPSPWLKIIPFNYLPDPFSIIKCSPWLKDSINMISVNQAIHSLLSFSDNDIRKVSLQFQVCGEDSNSILTREQQIYLSIPLCVQKVADPRKRRHFYADICELFVTVDHNDQIYDGYIEKVSDTFVSKREEQRFRNYFEFAKEKVKHTPFGPFDDLETAEIVYQACLNDVPVTRKASKPSLPAGHKIKPYEMAYVKSWNLWPGLKRAAAEASVKKVQENLFSESLKIEEVESQEKEKTENKNEVPVAGNDENGEDEVQEKEKTENKKKAGRKKKSDNLLIKNFF